MAENQTLLYLRRAEPDLAAEVEGGTLSPADAFSIALQRRGSSSLQDAMSGRVPLQPVGSGPAPGANDIWRTGTLLPIARDQQTGQVKWAVPKVLADALSAIAAPGNALQGKYPMMLDPTAPGGIDPYSAMIPDVMNLTGLVTLGAGAIPSEANVLRAGLAAMQRQPTKLISSFPELEGMLQDTSPLYVRWSRGPKYDLDPLVNSKDYQTGVVHNGLSSVKLSPDDGRYYLFKFLRDYSYSRGGAGRGALPHIYAGTELGLDSDASPLIRPSHYLGTLSPEFIKVLDDESIPRRLELMNAVANNKRALALPPDPRWVSGWTPESLQKYQSELDALGGGLEDHPVFRRPD